MSSVIFLSALFFFVYYDAKILRQQDDASYHLVLRSSPFNWAVFSVLLFVITLPIYLLRRRQFKKIQTRQWVFEITPLDQLSDALGMVILWMSGVFALTVFADFILIHLPVFKTKLGEALFSTIIEDVLMVFLIYWVTRRYPAGGFWASVGLPRREISFFKVIVVPAAVGLILAYGSSLSRLNDAHPPATPLSQLLDGASASAILIFIGSAIFLAPFIEEIIFRGYFYGVAERLKGKIFAVFFAALSFALMHVWQYWGDWTAIGVVTVLGFVLSFFRAAHGLTLPSIVTHYVYNGFSVIFPFLLLMQSHSVYFEYQFKYNQLDDLAKEALLKKSIDQQPQWDAAYNDLAWLYAKRQEKLDEALQLIGQALKLDPDNDAYWDTKAEVLFHMKRFAEAIEIEKGLISRNPDEKIYKDQLEKFKKGFEQERARLMQGESKD